jgi:hypothetical protein
MPLSALCLPYFRFSRNPPAIGGKRHWRFQLPAGVLLGSEEDFTGEEYYISYHYQKLN